MKEIILNRRIFLTLKAPITTAADDIHKYVFIVFQKKIRLDVLSESSARQRIHMKNQALFSSTGFTALPDSKKVPINCWADNCFSRWLAQLHCSPSGSYYSYKCIKVDNMWSGANFRFTHGPSAAVDRAKIGRFLEGSANMFPRKLKKFEMPFIAFWASSDCIFLFSSLGV